MKDKRENKKTGPATGKTNELLRRHAVVNLGAQAISREMQVTSHMVIRLMAAIRATNPTLEPRNISHMKEVNTTLGMMQAAITSLGNETLQCIFSTE